MKLNWSYLLLLLVGVLLSDLIEMFCKARGLHDGNFEAGLHPLMLQEVHISPFVPFTCLVHLLVGPSHLGFVTFECC
jgi:hypothetical protein